MGFRTVGEAANHEAEYHLLLHWGRGEEGAGVGRGGGGGLFNVDLNDSVLAYGLKPLNSWWDATVGAKTPLFVSPTTHSLILVPLGS